jgi:LysR family transcriptional regulator for metE and metH
MDLEIRHLLLVSAVAEHQSLTKAGDVLHLSQSALSHQLRDIEDRLGTRLFHRLNKRMLPTPAGDRLLESARTVLSELTATEVAIRTGLGQRPIPLRLSTECYTCYHWLPPVLKPFRQSFPHVDVCIDPTATSDPIGRLLQGDLDLAIVSSPVKHARLAVRPLFDDEQVLLLPADHRLARRPYARLTDFKEERLLTYTGGADSHFLTRVLRPAGVAPAHVETVKLTEAAIEMVRAGLGVAVLSRWAVAPHLRRGSLVALRITPDGHSKHWCAVVHEHLAEADYVCEFLRLVIANAPAATGPEVVPFPTRPGRRTRDATFASSR